MSNSSHPDHQDDTAPDGPGDAALAPTYELMTAAETLDASMDTYLDRQPAGKNDKQPVYKLGDTIGRYVLLETIGAGGMGTVWTAFDTKLDRKVALKLLQAIYASSEHARRRLEREARALAQLSHPNVVQVHDVEVHNNQVFVAMEYVDGMSLREWCRSRPAPSWREVLDAYVEAARGVAAAHAKGLIHRDFKPANALMGHDGRVRVVDFGLAIAQRERTTERDTQELGPKRNPPKSTPPKRKAQASKPRAVPKADTAKVRASLAASGQLSGEFDERLTSSGLVIGTPVYMAPEQHLSGEVGPPADQYSLCASLYEGLYDKAPFGEVRGKGGIDELMERKLRGAVMPAPDDTEVPAWLHKVLLRGMEPEPDDRFPSINALIAALTNDPARRRRARARAAIFVGITLTSILLAIWSWTRDTEPAAVVMCPNLDAELAGVWDTEVKGAVRERFLATGLGYAPTTFDRVSTVLHGYSSAWVAMRTEACEATRVHHTQTDEVMTLRMSCLNRRRSRLRALTQLFAGSTDPELVTNAVQAVQSLPPIEQCADVEALSAAFPLPANSRLRSQIEGFEERADEVEARTDAGKYREALALGEELLEELLTIDFAPVRARALYVVGFLRDDAGDYTGAEALLRQTIQEAARARDSVLVAKASSLLQFTIGYSQRRYEVALDMEDWVLAAAELADDDIARGEARNHLALVLRRMERHERARQLLQEAVVLLEKALGPEHPSLAIYTSNLASVLLTMGNDQEAQQLASRALNIRRKALGDDHPDVGSSLKRLAGVQIRMGDYPRAKDLLEQALSIRERTRGPEHRQVATAANDLGYTLYKMGRYEESRSLFERALAIYKKSLQPNDPKIAGTLSNLGDALVWMRRHEEAESVCRQALTICEKDLGPDSRCAANALFGLGRAALHEGDIDTATRHLQRVQRIYESTLGQHDRALAAPLSELGQLHLLQNAMSRAVPLLERALALTNAPLDVRALTLFRLSQALRLSDNEKKARALALAEESKALFRRMGNKAMTDEVESWLTLQTNQ